MNDNPVGVDRHMLSESTGHGTNFLSILTRSATNAQILDSICLETIDVNLFFIGNTTWLMIMITCVRKLIQCVTLPQSHSGMESKTLEWIQYGIESRTLELSHSGIESLWN